MFTVTGKSKRSCSTSAAERDLTDYVKELERAKTLNFNSTLTLHRMQMWHAIGEKLKRNDSEAVVLKAVTDRCMALCSQIKQFQQESKDLQDEVTEAQKKRLEIKQLIHENMKEMEDLKSKKEHEGIILACKINWMDDPKLRDIAMMLEDLPFSD
ncbi:hypothetical protein F7725_012686 [Dissostichus mawsoni]|uniref:Centromere protein H C-terminal domain-containing protein n=1 Tax=Dissostichus mawsoni TaxID=36200 RepID=A0A7J5YMY9_DISMA|nr:hypothetical protein F7725_012686 [Dissostichus mawsoni]